MSWRISFSPFHLDLQPHPWILSRHKATQASGATNDQPAASQKTKKKKKKKTANENQKENGNEKADGSQQEPRVPPSTSAIMINGENMNQEEIDETQSDKEMLEALQKLAIELEDEERRKKKGLREMMKGIKEKRKEERKNKATATSASSQKKQETAATTDNREAAAPAENDRDIWLSSEATEALSKAAEAFAKLPDAPIGTDDERQWNEPEQWQTQSFVDIAKYSSPDMNPTEETELYASTLERMAQLPVNESNAGDAMKPIPTFWQYEKKEEAGRIVYSEISSIDGESHGESVPQVKDRPDTSFANMQENHVTVAELPSKSDAPVVPIRNNRSQGGPSKTSKRKSFLPQSQTGKPNGTAPKTRTQAATTQEAVNKKVKPEGKTTTTTGNLVSKLPQIRNEQLRLDALTHGSHAAVEGGNRKMEQLAYLGDALLYFLVTDFLCNQCGMKELRKIGPLRDQLVSNRLFSEIAVKCGIADQIRFGKGMDKATPGPVVYATAFEAWVGAYFLDTSVEHVRAFMTPIFAELVANELQLPKSLFEKLTGNPSPVVTLASDVAESRSEAPVDAEGTKKKSYSVEVAIPDGNSSKKIVVRIEMEN